MAALKDAKHIAKEARGEPLHSMNGYIRCLVTVNPFINEKYM